MGERLLPASYCKGHMRPGGGSGRKCQRQIYPLLRNVVLRARREASSRIQTA
jgi:hypothetical protein